MALFITVPGSSDVTINDLAGVIIPGGTTHYEITKEFSIDEINNSQDLNSYLGSGTIHMEDEHGNTITDLTNNDIMQTPTYDQNNDGTVDNTENLSGQLPSYYLDRANHTGTQSSTTLSDKGSVNGVAELDSNGRVPSSQLPSYVDDVVEYASSSDFPATGESGKIYIALDTNITYRWGSSAYVAIGSSLALGETSSTAYRGDRGKIAYDHSQLVTGNPHNVTKADVGLSNVDDTSDADKPISTAVQTALDGKEDAFSKNSAFNKDFGTTAGTVTEGNDPRLSDSRPPIAHAQTHTDGTDDIQLATNSVKGLLSPTKYSEIVDNTSHRETINANPHLTTLEQTRIQDNKIEGDIDANNNTINNLKDPIAGDKNPIVYDSSDELWFYDTSRNKELSVNKDVFYFGRNSSHVSSQYLRIVNGMPSDDNSYRLPYNCTLIGILMTQNGASGKNWEAQVTKNDSSTVEASVSITSGEDFNKDMTLNVDFNENDKIQVNLNKTGSSNISYPIVQLYFRRRK